MSETIKPKEGEVFSSGATESDRIDNDDVVQHVHKANNRNREVYYIDAPASPWVNLERRAREDLLQGLPPCNYGDSMRGSHYGKLQKCFESLSETKPKTADDILTTLMRIRKLEKSLEEQELALTLLDEELKSVRNVQPYPIEWIITDNELKTMDLNHIEAEKKEFISDSKNFVTPAPDSLIEPVNQKKILSKMISEARSKNFKKK